MTVELSEQYTGEDPVIGYTIREKLSNETYRSYWFRSNLNLNERCESHCFCKEPFWVKDEVKHNCGFHGYITKEGAEIAIDHYEIYWSTGMVIIRTLFEEIKEIGYDATFPYIGYDTVPKVIVAKYITLLEEVE